MRGAGLLLEGHIERRRVGLVGTGLLIDPGEGDLKRGQINQVAFRLGFHGGQDSLGDMREATFAQGEMRDERLILEILVLEFGAGVDEAVEIVVYLVNDRGVDAQIEHLVTIPPRGGELNAEREFADGVNSRPGFSQARSAVNPLWALMVMWGSTTNLFEKAV